jgi:hypothetical protein
MNLVKTINKLCTPMKVYALLASCLLLLDLSEKKYTIDMNVGIDMVVIMASSAFIMRLCKKNNVNMAYGVVGVYLVYWMMQRSASDVENFQKCKQVNDPCVSNEFCDNKYSNEFKDGVGAFAGASKDCSKQSEICNVGKYYKKRAGWIQQQDLSMPDGPPDVAKNCLSTGPGFNRPCSVLDTPATKLRNYPIDTDNHQPHYRSCHENPLKVQIAYDPAVQPYEEAKRV